MTRPGVDVTTRAEPLPRTAPTDTGPWFIAGITGTDPGEPTRVRSMTEYVARFGDRQGGPLMYDHAETYFREGGHQLWVSSGTDVVDALNLFTKAYGPGQVSIPGGYDEDIQSAVLAHAEANNRVALLGVEADQTVAELTTTAGRLQSDANARYGALFAPQAIIPGVAGATTRKVGYEAVEAGIIARNDAVMNQNQASAGDQGQCAWTLDVDARFSDADRYTLNEASCNIARLMYGGVRTYGYRSLADKDGPAGQWTDFGWCRLNMAIVAQAEVIGEHYVFAQLDGRGHTIAEFGSDLYGMLAPMYTADALYGATPEEAYQVHVDDRVNTPETIANGELHAVIQVRMSPMAEWVEIEIVKVSTLQALAA